MYPSAELVMTKVRCKQARMNIRKQAAAVHVQLKLDMLPSGLLTFLLSLLSIVMAEDQKYYSILASWGMRANSEIRVMPFATQLARNASYPRGELS